MSSATPTLDQAINAVVAAIEAVSPGLGAVAHYESPYESDAETIDRFVMEDGTLDLWLVDGKTTAEEGDADGERYAIHTITVRYWSIRAQRTWSRQANARVALALDALDGNEDIFAIGGQRQLRTEETAAVVSSGFTDRGGQRVYEVAIEVEVEGRRWS